MDRTAAEVRRACSAVLAQEKYEPLADGTTFCNLALHDILTRLGLPEFCIDSETKRPYLANDLTEKLETLARELTYEEAFRLSNEGAVIVAAMKMPYRGHVALIYPSPGQYTSGKWKRGDVPFVANVGGLDKEGNSMNGVRPLNWAFGAAPRLWLVAR